MVGYVVPVSGAARKFDTKVASLLPKVTQKVATLKNWFKTSFQQDINSYILWLYLRAGSELFQNQF